MEIIPLTLFWFRRDLRVHDNHGFFEALKAPQPVLPVFIFDKNILSDLTDKKDRRISYVYQALENLDKIFREAGSSLLVVYENPLSAIQSICEKFPIKRVVTNHDYEPYAIKRDLKISEWLKTKNISFLTFKDQVIFEKDEITKADRSPYSIFTPYSKIWKQKLSTSDINNYPSEKNLNKLFKTNGFENPTLKEIGFDKAHFEPYPLIPDQSVIIRYHESRNNPSENGTSRMSVALRFGTTSIRDLVKIAVDLNEQWLNELIWREFFMMIIFHNPRVVTESFKKQYDAIQWINNEKDFEAWCLGETGYPIVDAGMRQLNNTGWMHNRVRMIVASFLTKHLLIDWRWGEAYFAEKLMDYELSSNNGNWQWAAGCGCDAAPYFRVFNPAEQLRKFDSNLTYTKRWINDYSSNYPKPIIDHNFARERAINTYKKALLASK